MLNGTQQFLFSMFADTVRVINVCIIIIIIIIITANISERGVAAL